MSSSLFKRIFWRFGRFFLLLYVSITIFGCVAADRIIFQPPESTYDDGLSELFFLEGEEGPIAARSLARPENKYWVLFSHGNAEDLGFIQSRVNQIHAAGFNVLCYDYRGYGLTKGKPSESGCYEDILTAWNYLLTKTTADHIIIWGRSVGSGPSTWLASEKKAAMLLLESPFTSTFRVVTQLKLFPFDRFDNLGRIDELDEPLWIVHGNQDLIIFLSHGKRLFAAANSPKYMTILDGAGHNDVMERAGNEILENLKRLIAGESTPPEYMLL